MTPFFSIGGEQPTRAGDAYLRELERHHPDLPEALTAMHRLLWIGRPISLIGLRRCLRHHVGRTAARTIESGSVPLAMIWPADSGPAY